MVSRTRRVGARPGRSTPSMRPALEALLILPVRLEVAACLVGVAATLGEHRAAARVVKNLIAFADRFFASLAAALALVPCLEPARIALMPGHHATMCSSSSSAP